MYQSTHSLHYEAVCVVTNYVMAVQSSTYQSNIFIIYIPYGNDSELLLSTSVDYLLLSQAISALRRSQAFSGFSYFNTKETHAPYIITTSLPKHRIGSCYNLVTVSGFAPLRVRPELTGLGYYHQIIVHGSMVTLEGNDPSSTSYELGTFTIMLQSLIWRTYQNSNLAYKFRRIVCNPLHYRYIN